MPAKIDAELDLHGYTAAEARNMLDAAWSRRAWQGMRRVRIIHGTGEVLYKTVRKWADDRAIPWTLEAYNPGVTILQPALRRDPGAGLVHRPFAKHEAKLRSVERPPESPPTAPEPSVDKQHAQDLFAQEIEALEKQDARQAHKKKHGLR